MYIIKDNDGNVFHRTNTEQFAALSGVEERRKQAYKQAVQAIEEYKQKGGLRWHVYYDSSLLAAPSVDGGL